MRIQAVVEVVNRNLAPMNMRSKRPEKSYLSIGFVPNKKDKLFILHQTQNNSCGIKYKVCDVSFFERFLQEGKLTIRFKEPPIDLIIKSDSKHLEGFLKVIKSALTSESSQVPGLSNLLAAPTKVTSGPSDSLVVRGKKELPVLARSLKYLAINSCKINKLDGRIFRLQQLKVLDLKDNDLEDIPCEIGLLTSLEELILQGNKLGRKSNFVWLARDSLCKNLVHLDLKKNEMTFAPQVLVRLKKLKTLHLDDNLIRELPKALGFLHNLKILTVSNNRINILPGSMMALRLHHFDFSSNHFSRHLHANFPQTPHFPLLVELAGITVIKERIIYEGSLPHTLSMFLGEAGYCICGLPSFSTEVAFISMHEYDLKRFCRSYQITANSPIYFCFNICNTKNCLMNHLEKDIF